MSEECRRVQALFESLMNQPRHSFPEKRARLEATTARGVYIIFKNSTDKAVHVGRTPRAKRGIAQRLNNHLQGKSSFTQEYLNGDGSKLRGGAYSYRYLAVENPRLRALLENYAIANLCPEHLGLGEETRS